MRSEILVSTTSLTLFIDKVLMNVDKNEDIVNIDVEWGEMRYTDNVKIAVDHRGQGFFNIYVDSLIKIKELLKTLTLQPIYIYLDEGHNKPQIKYAI